MKSVLYCLAAVGGRADGRVGQVGQPPPRKGIFAGRRAGACPMNLDA